MRPGRKGERGVDGGRRKCFLLIQFKFKFIRFFFPYASKTECRSVLMRTFLIGLGFNLLLISLALITRTIKKQF